MDIAAPHQKKIVEFATPVTFISHNINDAHAGLIIAYHHEERENLAI